MFYYWTSFSKKAVFLEKIAKTLFVGRYDHFEGRVAPGDKNPCNILCGHRRFEYFSSNKFKKKKQYFSKYKWKIIFAERNNFWVKEESDDKNEYDIFFGKWGTKYSVQVFFSKTPIPSDLNPKTRFWGTFSPISVVLLGRLFPKTIGFTMRVPTPTMWILWKSDHNCDLYRNFFYIHTYIYTHTHTHTHTHIYIYIFKKIRFRRIEKNS